MVLLLQPIDSWYYRCVHHYKTLLKSMHRCVHHMRECDTHTEIKEKPQLLARTSTFLTLGLCCLLQSAPS